MNIRDEATDLRGIIIAYSAAVKAGLIKGENGRQYVFESGDWHSVDEPPRDGLLVRFSARRRRALEVAVSQKEFISRNPSRPSAPRG